MKITTLGVVLSIGLLAATMNSSGQSVFNALNVPSVGVGNESSGENPIGNDFRVVSPVLVTELGMFDSGGDGIKGSAVIIVELCESSPENKAARSVLETLSFDAGSPGELVGGMRYKKLARPVTLLPGHYTLTARGFDESNPEYNHVRPLGQAARRPVVVVNKGGGLIEFLGVHHRNDLTLRSKDMRNMGAPNHFAAATFVYSAAVMPVNPFALDYAALTAGVTTFPIDGGNSNVHGGKLVLNRYSSIAVLRDNAFPVIVEPSGNRLIFAAAGIYDGDKSRARCVVFSHEQFGQALNDSRMALFENAIKWASRKQNPAEIVVALATNLNSAYFVSRGYHVRAADRGMKTNDWNPMPGADVLVMDFDGPPYTERFMARAAEFAANGGGIVATSSRFLHADTRPMLGRVNGLLKPFGLAYRSSLVEPVDFGFTTVQVVAYAPQLFNAFPAAQLLRKNREGQIQLSSLEKSIALNTISYAADRQPEMLAELSEIYSGSLNNPGSGAGLPEGTAFTDVVTFTGAQARKRSGLWQEVEGDLVAMSERGGVEYSFDLLAADIYRIGISGSQNTPHSVFTNFDLVISVDNVLLGERRLTAAYGTSGQVDSLTPFLLPGSHTLRIFWDNPSSRTQFRLKGVRIQNAPGADTDGDGTKDWVQEWVGSRARMDSTNFTLSSYVSPLCLEGRDSYPDLATADVSGAEVATSKLKPIKAPNGRWYVNVPLSSVGDTGFRISYQNGARTEVRRLRWLPVNVLEGGSYTVRKNDKFALIARPPGASGPGEMEFNITTNQYQRKLSNPLVYEFNTPGTVTVKGTYKSPDGRSQNGSITVNVVEHRFMNSPACWVGSERDWKVPLPGAAATLEADSRLFFETIGGLPGGGWQTAMLIDQNEPRYLLSRLGAHGPVLDSGVVRGFDFWSGNETYLNVVQTYPDGSQLVEMLLISSPVLPEVRIKVDLIVGGVIFEDGTTSKNFKAGDFDNLGRCKVRFIRPASAKTSVCHSIKVYENQELIGYIR